MSALSPNQFGAYLRLGDWPEDERSMNHATGWKEEGVSVYEMNHIGHPLDPDPGGESESGDTYGDMMNRFHRSRRGGDWTDSPADRAHIVTGEMVGVGHDGEPVLNNVRKVGNYPHDLYRFVPGEQGRLF